MKVLIAPDSFKESLSAAAVADAIAAGVRRARPDVEVVLIPVADGGEGTVDAVVAACDGEMVAANVTGPLGGSVTARYGVVREANTAVIEMAEAAGLHLVPPERRNPLLTTTRGVGELVLHALDRDVQGFLIGIGGSATVDGGCGMAAALGVRFLDRKGAPIGPGGARVAELANIDMSARDERLAEVDIRVACDVTNPLVGPDGAACVYAPQKGAQPGQVELLERALENLASVIERDVGVDVRDSPGAGAAGGLGAGLVAFLDARLVKGAEAVIATVGLERALRDVDLVITGEGSLDRQTAYGKAATAVARAARDAGVPVAVIAGQVNVTKAQLREMGIAEAWSLVDDRIPPGEAIARAASLLEQRAAEIARAWA